MHTYDLTRRQVIGAALLAACGTEATFAMSNAATSRTQGLKFRRNRVARFAHLSDIHLASFRQAPQGLEAALRHVQSLDDKPEMIITGGDIVNEVLAANEESAAAQFMLAKKVFKEHCHLPVRHCLGNHDIWGWDKKSNTAGTEPLWGKKRPIQEFDMPDRYYAFDLGGWRIIILDTMFATPYVFTARVDDEQFQWLAGELEAHEDRPVCIIGHIPILTVTAFMEEHSQKDGQWRISHQSMLLDACKFTDLFYRHRNVKLCISGHMHMLDRIEFNNVVYITEGAVCGCWWTGPFNRCPEGYGLFDLYDDGTFGHEYVTYGWTAARS